MQALVGGCRAGGDGPALEIELLGAEAADGIHEQAHPTLGAQACERFDRVEPPGRRLVMHQRQVRDVLMLVEKRAQTRVVDRLAPLQCHRNAGYAVDGGDFGETFAVDAVLDDQHLAVGGAEAGDHRLHRRGAGAGQEDGGVALGVEIVDPQQPLADRTLQLGEFRFAMTEIGTAHRRAHARAQRDGTGIEQQQRLGFGGGHGAVGYPRVTARLVAALRETGFWLRTGCRCATSAAPAPAEASPSAAGGPRWCQWRSSDARTSDRCRRPAARGPALRSPRR